MSIVAISLNLMLAALLVAALFVGVRLERRLKAVRDGQLAFAQAVSDLDQSAMRAREGLAELRAATDEATDTLGGRITRARDAAERLEALIKRADGAGAYTAPAPVAAAPTGAEGGLVALLQRLKDAEATIAPPTPQFAAPRAAAAPARPARAMRPADDDLFEDFGARA